MNKQLKKKLDLKTAELDIMSRMKDKFLKDLEEQVKVNREGNAALERVRDELERVKEESGREIKRLKDAIGSDDVEMEVDQNTKDQLEFLARLKNTGSGTILPKLTCEKCNEEITGENEMERHMKRHDDGDWRCTKCSFQTDREDSLMNHSRTQSRFRLVTNVMNTF